MSSPSAWRVPALDIALALALMTYAVVATAGDHLAVHPWAELAALIMAGSLLLRTGAPLVMALVATTGTVGFALLPNPTTPLWAFLTILVVGFCVGAHLDGTRRRLALVALLAAGYLLQAASTGRADPSATVTGLVLTPLVIIGGPALAGGLLQHSRRQNGLLRRLGAELEAERERHTELAVDAERARIARELHDVISHAVTGMVVQAGAAEQLATDPVLRQQVHGIRETGKEALGELRRQLGLMRAGGSDPNALPGLAQLGRLAASCDASLTLNGLDGVVLPPGLDLTVYRVVQEALTNARRHAPGAPVSVELTRAASTLRIRVDDEGPGGSRETGAGCGLTGMRERVEMYGGTLQAGPRADAPG